MPKNKGAIIRYRAIDKCLRSSSMGCTIQELVDACDEAKLDNTGINEGVSKRTVYDDLNFMQSAQGFEIPLEKRKIERRVYYKYADKDFSIVTRPISESDAILLKEAVNTLLRFKGLPQFNWIERLVEKLESNYELIDDYNRIIQFDNNPYLHGIQHIDTLFRRIVNKEVIRLTYKSFKSESEKELVFHPYFLKEFNNRWFVFGLNADDIKVNKYALDRIKSIDPTSHSYIDPDFDLNDYLEDVIGVVKNDLEPVTITLEVSNELYPYIKSKPLHGSQTEIKNAIPKRIFKIEIIPNYEFYSLVLSHGKGVKIIEPESIKNEIYTIIKEMNNLYN